MLKFYQHLQPAGANKLLNIINNKTNICIAKISNNIFSIDTYTLLMIEAQMFSSSLNAKELLRFMTVVINKQYRASDERKFTKLIDLIVGNSTIMQMMKLIYKPADISVQTKANQILYNVQSSQQLSQSKLSSKEDYEYVLNKLTDFLLSEQNQQQQNISKERYLSQNNHTNENKLLHQVLLQKYIMKMIIEIQKQVINKQINLDPNKIIFIRFQDIIQLQTLFLTIEQRYQFIIFILNQYYLKNHRNQHDAILLWNEKSFFNVLNALQGRNLIGKLFLSDSQESVTLLQRAFQSIIYSQATLPQVFTKYIRKLVKYEYTYLSLYKHTQKEKLQKLSFTSKYLQQFSKHQHQKYKIYEKLSTNTYCHVKDVIKICQKYQNIAQNDIRIKFILKLFSIYQQTSDKDNQYHLLCLIKYTLFGPWHSLFNELNIQEENDIEIFIKRLQDGMKSVMSLDVLQTIISISKHVEFSQISLCFTSSFTIDSLSDDLINQLFNNLQNRIQYIYLDCKSKIKNLLLIRRNDGMIFKSKYVSDDIIEQIYSYNSDQQQQKTFLNDLNHNLENDSENLYQDVENDTPIGDTSNISIEQMALNYQNQSIELSPVVIVRTLNTQSVEEANNALSTNRNPNNYTYDAIIITSSRLHKLSLLKYRHLSFINTQSMKEKTINLGQQDSLLSICLNNIIVDSFDKCPNIQNVYLSYLAINENTFKDLRNIKRIYCKFVQNSSEKSLIQLLMKQNHLEYVQFNYCTNFISNGVTLVQNLDKLRLFLTNSSEVITIDLYNQELKDISVFESKEQHNVIGPINRVKNMQKQLIDNQINDIVT